MDFLHLHGFANPVSERTGDKKVDDVGVCHGRPDHDYLSATLSQLAMAVFLIDGTRRILLANSAAASMVRAADGLTAVSRKLRAACPQADAALQQAVSRAVASDHNGPRPREAVVPRVGRRPLLLSIAPLGVAAIDRLVSSETTIVIVVAMEPEARGWSRLDGIAHAYGLTAAESRFLEEILDGDGVVAAAARLGVTRTTARTHLRHIFEKTLTSRQSELIRLVAHTLPPLRH